MKLLDEKGLTTVWAAIKNTFTSKSDADEKYAEKSKALGSIDFDYTAWGINMSTYNVDGDSHGYINITSATSTTAGVMSASDKNKLDNIAAGANNYTLPTASDTTLGGIKTGFKAAAGVYWGVETDNLGNAYTSIGGLKSGHKGKIESIEMSGGTVYESAVTFDRRSIKYHPNGAAGTTYVLSYPERTGTFALTSDIPNVSDLCKLNFIDRPSDCVDERINICITTERNVSLNNITDREDGLILLLGCYNNSSHTIYCTDSSLYYKGDFFENGSVDGIAKKRMYLVTVKNSSVYVYPLD